MPGKNLLLHGRGKLQTKLEKHLIEQVLFRAVRKKVVGTAERPRMCVHKTLKHIYVQVVDDAGGVTLAFVTTNTKGQKAGGKKNFCNLATAKLVGQQIAEKAKAAGVTAVVFDRGGYAYHGIVKAVAEAAREAGLKF